MSRRVGNEQERGAAAVEYAILAAFIAAVIVGAVTVLGLRTVELFASLAW